MAEETNNTTGKKVSNFWIRLMSSVILMAVVITLNIIGGLPLLLGVGIISVIGLMELYRVFGIQNTPLAYLCCVFAAVLFILLYLSVIEFFVVLWLILAMVAILILYVFTYPKYNAVQIAQAVFGLVYVPLMLSFIYSVREMDNGYLIWLIFISAWGSDTLAYCTGMLIGKHKMTPVLSPKKTVEGGIGGVVGAALLGVVFGLIFGEKMSEYLANPVLSCGIICGVCGAVSMVGDLAASAIKRNYDIKDYGNLIPGHGGIMDRFDSVIVTAPMVYFLSVLLLG